MRELLSVVYTSTCYRLHFLWWHSTHTYSGKLLLFYSQSSKYGTGCLLVETPSDYCLRVPCYNLLSFLLLHCPAPCQTDGTLPVLLRLCVGCVALYSTFQFCLVLRDLFFCLIIYLVYNLPSDNLQHDLHTSPLINKQKKKRWKQCSSRFWALRLCLPFGLFTERMVVFVSFLSFLLFFSFPSCCFLFRPCQTTSSFSGAPWISGSLYYFVGSDTGWYLLSTVRFP